MTGKRQALFEGETTKGRLPTPYGFSTLDAKAGQAATAAFVGAGLVALLSLALGLRSALLRTSD